MTWLVLLFQTVPLFASDPACCGKKNFMDQFQAVIRATQGNQGQPAWVQNLSKQGFACEEKTDGQFFCRGSSRCSPVPIRFYGGAKSQGDWVHYHFHGHNLNGDGQRANDLHFNPRTGNGDFSKFLTDSNSSALVIAPESNGKVATYHQLFSNNDSSAKFFKCVQELAAVSASKVSLSSHSGSDTILNRLVGQQSPESFFGGRLIGVGLFDSLYADRPHLKKLSEQPSTTSLWNIYCDRASTQAHQNRFRNGSKSSSYHVEPVTGVAHMDILKDGRFVRFLQSIDQNQ